MRRLWQERPLLPRLNAPRRAYVCEHCGHQVYSTAGTQFDRTRTSLRDWFTVMFMFTPSRIGVAAKAVERQIGATYKTAWRMCHEIREPRSKAMIRLAALFDASSLDGFFCARRSARG